MSLNRIFPTHAILPLHSLFPFFLSIKDVSLPGSFASLKTAYSFVRRSSLVVRLGFLSSLSFAFFFRSSSPSSLLLCVDTLAFFFPLYALPYTYTDIRYVTRHSLFLLSLFFLRLYHVDFPYLLYIPFFIYEKAIIRVA